MVPVFTFPPTISQGSIFSTISATYDMCRLIDCGHSDRCVVIFHHGFDLILLMISNITYPLMFLLSIHMSLWRNLYSGILPILWLGFFFFWYWVVWPLWKFWILTSCSSIYLQILSLINHIAFVLPMVSFTVKKALSLFRPHLFIFAFIYFALAYNSNTALLQLMSKSVLPMLSFRSFMVFGLTFRSLSHFEVMFYICGGMV